jgi:hypothetical protein
MVRFMTLAALLTQLHELGILTVAAGDKLRLYPADGVPLHLVPLLREHKRAILCLLRPLPGWPADVPLPAWWPDLAGSLADVLIDAAPHICPGCRFPVAVRWRSRDGALRWACRRCGLHAGCGRKPGPQAAVLDGWDVVAGCPGCGAPADEAPRVDALGRCAGCAARVSPA